MLVQQEILTQFQKRPLNGVNGRCANKENSTTFNIWPCTVSLKSMAFLEGYGRMHTKINILWKQSGVISLVALEDLENAEKLVEMFACWKENGVENLYVTANVGKDKLNKTYLAT